MLITFFNKEYIPITTNKIPILFGELPLMTNRATFIINGYERIIINQIIRSPGIYFSKNNLNYTATLIPNSGSWLKFSINKKNLLTINIDQSEQINILELFNILQINTEQIFKNINNVNFEYLNQKTQNSLKPKNNELNELFLTNIFSKDYQLGYIGRYKLNQRLNLNNIKNYTDLTIQDIIIILNELINLKNEESGELDDIDHLENKRIRSVGQLIQTQIHVGLTRLEKSIAEKLIFIAAGVINPKMLISSKPIVSTIREFFLSSQLSQFLDQTNPIAELTHRRRITSLGPNGLNRENVSLSARDIHPSYYGRICPIETPEGENAGLVSSLSLYARINNFGFIETPFFQIKNGFVLKNQPPIYITAKEEDYLKIAASDTKLDENNKFLAEFITVRYKNEFIKVFYKEVDLISVSPFQILSLATALIPFVEHNDANRALMGANMQRQAVPLIFPRKTIIGTGLETQLASEAGFVIINQISGYVKEVCSNFIKIKSLKNKEILYKLQKYNRSNQDTCINQRPIVWQGEYIESGQIIADGPCSDEGEIALGQNVTIAYLSWEGYNFEDAILISERLIYRDLFTSVHIEKYSIEIEKTEEGSEKLTNKLPNINKSETENLDLNGVIKKGTFVCPGDILVGKIRPIKNDDVSPEERLLRAVFCEKVPNFKENCLRVPAGIYGRVISTQFLSYENEEELEILVEEFTVQVYIAQLRKIQVGDKMSGRHGNKGVISKILKREDMPYLPNGKPVDIILNPLGVPSRMNVGQLYEGLFGFAADFLDQRFKILPFDEMFEENASRILVNNALKKAKKVSKIDWIYKAPLAGKILLRDGRTGEYFNNSITVCKSYFLKLIHLVDDKIHTRSTGPYSLITQQPLGGRSRQGGQRFGEMEVWALEAFGAAYTLQELLTLKADDIIGRNETLIAIINGEKIPKPGIPESFKILILELQSLGLDITMCKVQQTELGEKSEKEINIIENKISNKKIPQYRSIEII